jgi:hypothetical protein
VVEQPRVPLEKLIIILVPWDHGYAVLWPADWLRLEI